jgi:hypothetical protein
MTETKGLIAALLKVADTQSFSAASEARRFHGAGVFRVVQSL